MSHSGNIVAPSADTPVKAPSQAPQPPQSAPTKTGRNRRRHRKSNLGFDAGQPRVQLPAGPSSQCVGVIPAPTPELDPQQSIPPPAPQQAPAAQQAPGRPQAPALQQAPAVQQAPARPQAPAPQHPQYNLQPYSAALNNVGTYNTAGVYSGTRYWTPSPHYPHHSVYAPYPAPHYQGAAYNEPQYHQTLYNAGSYRAPGPRGAQGWAGVQGSAQGPVTPARPALTRNQGWAAQGWAIIPGSAHGPVTPAGPSLTENQGFALGPPPSFGPRSIDIGVRYGSQNIETPTKTTTKPLAHSAPRPYPERPPAIVCSSTPKAPIPASTTRPLTVSGTPAAKRDSPKAAVVLATERKKSQEAEKAKPIPRCLSIGSMPGSPFDPDRNGLSQQPPAPEKEKGSSQTIPGQKPLAAGSGRDRTVMTLMGDSKAQDKNQPVDSPHAAAQPLPNTTPARSSLSVASGIGRSLVISDAADRATSEQQARSEKAVVDKAGAESAAAEKVVAKKDASEKGTAEKAETQKALAAAEKAVSVVMKAAAEAADKATPEKIVADKGATAKAAADKAAAEKAASATLCDLERATKEHKAAEARAIARARVAIKAKAAAEAKANTDTEVKATLGLKKAAEAKKAAQADAQQRKAAEAKAAVARVAEKAKAEAEALLAAQAKVAAEEKAAADAKVAANLKAAAKAREEAKERAACREKKEAEEKEAAAARQRAAARARLAARSKARTQANSCWEWLTGDVRVPDWPEAWSWSAPMNSVESAPGSNPERVHTGQREGGPMAYIGNLPGNVLFVDLGTELARYGELAYMDINRREKCAFVGFRTPEGFSAAIAASPIVVNGEKITIEKQRPKPYASYNIQFGDLTPVPRSRPEGGEVQTPELSPDVAEGAKRVLAFLELDTPPRESAEELALQEVGSSAQNPSWQNSTPVNLPPVSGTAKPADIPDVAVCVPSPSLLFPKQLEAGPSTARESKVEADHPQPIGVWTTNTPVGKEVLSTDRDANKNRERDQTWDTFYAQMRKELQAGKKVEEAPVGIPAQAAPWMPSNGGQALTAGQQAQNTSQPSSYTRVIKPPPGFEGLSPVIMIKTSQGSTRMIKPMPRRRLASLTPKASTTKDWNPLPQFNRPMTSWQTIAGPSNPSTQPGAALQAKPVTLVGKPPWISPLAGLVGKSDNVACERLSPARMAKYYPNGLPKKLGRHIPIPDAWASVLPLRPEGRGRNAAEEARYKAKLDRAAAATSDVFGMTMNEMVEDAHLQHAWANYLADLGVSRAEYAVEHNKYADPTKSEKRPNPFAHMTVEEVRDMDIATVAEPMVNMMFRSLLLLRAEGSLPAGHETWPRRFVEDHPAIQRGRKEEDEDDVGEEKTAGNKGKAKEKAFRKTPRKPKQLLGYPV